MERVPYLDTTLRRWQCGRSTFFAWPECGARLVSWYIELADGTIRELIHWPEVESLEAPGRIRGGNPILFPFAGRTFCGGRENRWRHTDGVERPMPRHGFAREGRFEVTEIDEVGFTASLQPTARDQEAYPFDYEFMVKYRFFEESFVVDLILVNRGSVAMPWSPGHHFYFPLPWRPDESRSDYSIHFAAGAAWRHASDGQLQSVPLPDGPYRFDDADLVDRIHTGLRSSEIVFGPTGDPGEQVRMRIGRGGKPDADVALVTWSERHDSPFYCVEPWMGPPNAAEHGRGLQVVGAGKTEQFAVEVTV